MLFQHTYSINFSYMNSWVLVYNSFTIDCKVDSMFRNQSFIFTLFQRTFTSIFQAFEVHSSVVMPLRCISDLARERDFFALFLETLFVVAVVVVVSTSVSQENVHFFNSFSGHEKKNHILGSNFRICKKKNF